MKISTKKKKRLAWGIGGYVFGFLYWYFVASADEIATVGERSLVAGLIVAPFFLLFDLIFGKDK